MGLTQSTQWRQLTEHFDTIKDLHMRDLFKQDPERASRFSLEACGLYLDYSKNRISQTSFDLLIALAQEAGVARWRDQIFSGDKINHTENRAVLHSALRLPADQTLTLGDKNILADVHQVHEKLSHFVEAIHSGAWTGWTGKAIKTIVNIGIGGSHLGPELVVEALHPFADKGIKCRFVSNVDAYQIKQTLNDCQAEETLFIISSKSFTTSETRQNAETARAWFLQQGAQEGEIQKHFVAVSSNIDAATEFGIAEDNIFPIWDWVGGRYSLWSAIGMPIALCNGMEQFKALLDGAHQMDQHFQSAPLQENMPVILALLGIWYINFFNMQSYAVIPYDERLNKLPNYLQQLDMESNGKHIDRQGEAVDYETGPVIWGATGTNGQHAFFQLLHQGTPIIPLDFIAARSHPFSLIGQHRSLLANCLAQSEALMLGKTRDQAELDLKVKHNDEDSLIPYFEFNGNRPSNTLVLDELTAPALGALIALYEHKVFVQGVIWDINSFDQWGVEYGKRMAAHVEARLMDPESKLIPTNTDQGNISTSTERLIERLNRVPHK